MIEVKEIVVVCDPSYNDIFEGHSLSLAHAHTFTHTDMTAHKCAHMQACTHTLYQLAVFVHTLAQVKWICMFCAFHLLGNVALCLVVS